MTIKRTFSIIGCGRVGCSLARWLPGAGFRPRRFYSRTATSAERAAAFAGEGETVSSPWAAAEGADLVFITTPDDAIGPVCDRMTDNNGFSAGTAVFHCSGLHPSSILSSVHALDCVAGSLHPLRSIAAPIDDGVGFSETVFSIEGDPAAAKVGADIATSLGGRAVPIRTEAKALYHAAAVMASNYLVTLMHGAVGLLEGAGMAADQVVGVLMPLVRGTLDNIETVGPESALTGPVARGDVDTIRAHLSAMVAHMPDGMELYNVLGRHTLRMAVTSGRLDPSVGEAIRALLGEEKAPDDPG